MKKFLFVWCLAVSVSLHGNIEPYLKSNLQHSECSLQGVDAIFVFENNRGDKSSYILEQFEECSIQPSYNKMVTLHSVPDDIVAKYCSQNVSPELLAQILNHLSIYKYALENHLSSILIVESRSTLKRNAQEIENALKELSKRDRNWDLLFVSTDFCYGKEGENHIAPQIMEEGRLKPNKIALSKNLSKLFSRYGCSSYVISSRGMEKILQFFRSHWLDLPLDQALFQIPKAHYYTVNRDVIINGLYRKRLPKQSLPCYIERKSYPLGEEFWIDPYELLKVDRFDIIVKYLYAKSYLENIELDRFQGYYLEHIKKWNNFYEGSPLKIGPGCFLRNFHQLIDNLRLHGFDPFAEPIPINTMGVIINGSHRVGACLALSIPVKVKVQSEAKKIHASRDSFANKMEQSHHVSKDTIDQLVKGYVGCKSNTYAVRFDRGCEGLADQISQYVDIVYLYKEKDLYVIESNDWNMVNRLTEGLSNLGPHIFNHEETLSILYP